MMIRHLRVFACECLIYTAAFAIYLAARLRRGNDGNVTISFPYRWGEKIEKAILRLYSQARTELKQARTQKPRARTIVCGGGILELESAANSFAARMGRLGKRSTAK